MVDLETQNLITCLCNSNSEPERKIGRILDLFSQRPPIDPVTIAILALDGQNPCDFCEDDEVADCECGIPCVFDIKVPEN